MDKNAYANFIFPVAAAKTLVQSQRYSKADIEAMGGEPCSWRAKNMLDCYNRGLVPVALYVIDDNTFELLRGVSYPEDILRQDAATAHYEIQRIRDSQKKNPFF